MVEGKTRVKVVEGGEEDARKALPVSIHFICMFVFLCGVVLSDK